MERDTQPLVFFLFIPKQLYQTQCFFIASISYSMSNYCMGYFSKNIHIIFYDNRALYLILYGLFGILHVSANKFVQCLLASRILGLAHKVFRPCLLFH